MVAMRACVLGVKWRDAGILYFNLQNLATLHLSLSFLTPQSRASASYCLYSARSQNTRESLWTSCQRSASLRPQDEAETEDKIWGFNGKGRIARNNQWLPSVILNSPFVGGGWHFLWTKNMLLIFWLWGLASHWFAKVPIFDFYFNYAEVQRVNQLLWNS